jgi:hypothetical protein
MKLQIVHTAIEIQAPNNKRECFVNVEVEPNKSMGVTLDLVHIDEVKTTFVVLNYRGLDRPKFIPLANVRTLVPYPPEKPLAAHPEEAKAPKKGK